MQSLAWYIRRLSTMSPQAVAWRMRSAWQEAADRCLVSVRQRPRPLATILNGHGEDVAVLPRLDGMTAGGWAASAPGGPEQQWCRSLPAKADEIVAHRLPRPYTGGNRVRVEH